MPVLIKSLIINGEVGKTEVGNANQNRNDSSDRSNNQRILRLEELTDQILQILNDKKER